MPDLSLVIPLLNEEESLRPLMEQIRGVLATQDRTYEVIFIDDGSTDGSIAVLEDLHNTYPKSKSSNFGATLAKPRLIPPDFNAHAAHTSSPWTPTCKTTRQKSPTSYPKSKKAMTSSLDGRRSALTHWAKPCPPNSSTGSRALYRGLTYTTLTAASKSIAAKSQKTYAYSANSTATSPYSPTWKDIASVKYPSSTIRDNTA